MSYDDLIILCLETRQAVIRSIQHWQRMIACVEKMYDKVLEAEVRYYEEISTRLEETIGETVGSTHCALCELFCFVEDDDDEDWDIGGYCYRPLYNDYVREVCPLSLIGEACFNYNSAYDNVISSVTPREWLAYAHDLLDILQNFLTVPFTTA